MNILEVERRLSNAGILRKLVSESLSDNKLGGNIDGRKF